MQDIIEDVSKFKKYPSQETVYNNPYEIARGNKQPRRHFKEIGLGYETPKSAMVGTYIDKKCPFTSDVTIRGIIFKGEVVSLKQMRTAVVVKRYLHYHPKYMRYERRNTRFNVHLSPCWDGLVEVGDKVVCGETRPLSKTKHFAVISYEKAEKKGGHKQFTPEE
ncbi:small subunit ribosomal protein S11e [Nematocida minor]|uniref:small subunit ribosomal protein S11e n=1 Tax=Nematocida minor TaxID=1912983 RepID=UPI002220FFE1|nr:small subunit ribosomal protein S11e [Nematocida minor]KAI5192772.1 small subunit ribosomal protein S11e [Nematocida minor]